MMKFAEKLARARAVKPGEIVTRQTAQDYSAMGGWLPNPDEILRKIGQDINIFRTITTDAHLAATMSSRKSGVLSQMWEVNRVRPGEKAIKSPAADAFRENLKRLDVYRIMGEILGYADFGFQPLEILWENEAGKLWAGDIMGKPPEWFMFDDLNRLRFCGAVSKSSGDLVPDFKFLLPRQNPTFQNPYGDANLSKCYWPVTFKRANIQFFIAYVEKYGSPFAIGKLPRSSAEADFDNMVTLLDEICQDGVTAIPDDGSVELLEANRKDSGDLYMQLIQWANSEISKAQLGHDSAADATPGKLGGDNTAMKVRDDIALMDKRMVEATFNQFAKWFTDVNFGGQDYPTFCLYDEDDVDKELADRDAVLSQQGVRFTPAYYTRYYSIPEEYFTVAAPVAAAPQFSMFAGAPAATAPDGGQAAVDELMAQPDKELQAQAQAALAPVIELIRTSKNYAEAMEGVAKLYPEMDTSALEATMQKAIFKARLEGVTNAG